MIWPLWIFSTSDSLLLRSQHSGARMDTPIWYHGQIHSQAGECSGVQVTWVSPFHGFTTHSMVVSFDMFHFSIPFHVGQNFLGESSEIAGIEESRLDFGKGTPIEVKCTTQHAFSLGEKSKSKGAKDRGMKRPFGCHMKVSTFGLSDSWIFDDIWCLSNILHRKDVAVGRTQCERGNVSRVAARRRCGTFPRFERWTSNAASREGWGHQLQIPSVPWLATVLEIGYLIGFLVDECLQISPSLVIFNQCPQDRRSLANAG